MRSFCRAGVSDSRQRAALERSRDKANLVIASCCYLLISLTDFFGGDYTQRPSSSHYMRIRAWASHGLWCRAGARASTLMMRAVSGVAAIRVYKTADNCGSTSVAMTRLGKRDPLRSPRRHRRSSRVAAPEHAIASGRECNHGQEQFIGPEIRRTVHFDTAREDDRQTTGLTDGSCGQLGSTPCFDDRSMLVW